MPFKWYFAGMMPNIECRLGSFVIFQGIWTSIAKKPYIFVIFHGGQDPLVFPLDPHMDLQWTVTVDCETEPQSDHILFSTYTPTKWSDAQPLVEREKQFECRPVENFRS